MSSGNGMVRADGGLKAPFSLGALLEDCRLVVVGGSGFLGKVFWLQLLDKFPELGHLYLVLRPRAGKGALERYQSEVLTSPALQPLRQRYGSGLDAFLRHKVSVLEGDIVQPYCGLSAVERDALRGSVAAVVNASGVVDFDPPLDIALEVNAFGVQNLAALARDLRCSLLHTSTCFVAGSRTGFVEEHDPRIHPFPRAGELEQAHWAPEREIAECLDVIEQARQRAGDAFRQSSFLAEAKANLERRYEPTSGEPLAQEVARVRRRFIEAWLAKMGTERAKFWGWCNTYTYTKSLGEQMAAASGVPFTIVRPAVIESSLHFPFAGWNEGINTSAPLIYAIRQGQPSLPGSHHHLDLIPVDMVASGMIVALGELLAGHPQAVYQLGSSDSNPVTMARVFELVGLYKRKYYQRTQAAGPLWSSLQAHFEGAMQSSEGFDKFGPKAIASGARSLSKVLRWGAVGRAEPLLAPAADALGKLAETQEKLGHVLGQFAPFTAEYDYTFRCDNVRAALARLPAEEQQLLGWAPENIDWRHWMLEVHIPGLEKWVFPQIEKRVHRPRAAPRSYPSLPALLDEAVRRFDLAVALQRVEAEGLASVSFRQWRERALGCAAQLSALGIEPGDRVALVGANDPEWAIAFFGVLYAGATVVPVDPQIDGAGFKRVMESAQARAVLLDAKAGARLDTAEFETRRLGLSELTRSRESARGLQDPPARCLAPDDLAVLLFTSGTTGSPKGVMLTHHNFASLVASLGPLFPLTHGDRVLSVLPLHHTFELTCGLLLPLSRGARVVYLGDVQAERLVETLKTARITAMVGVPALWQAIERRIRQRVTSHGAWAAKGFDFAVDVHRALQEHTGIDAGRLLFGSVHAELGGNLRYVVSGGAALPLQTQRFFSGLGLGLAEGYGLTEAAPVLTVATGAGRRGGHVGKPLPGIELSIAEPDDQGVGEVLARGPNVMLGYYRDEAATRAVLDDQGWLRTGDLGKLDGQGNLTLVGRSKDVIVGPSGENVYPDDVERALGDIDGVEELCILGITDEAGVERVVCVARAKVSADEEQSATRTRAASALERAAARLPSVQRPAFTHWVDAPLPRTPTRKVKRRQLRHWARQFQQQALQRDRATAVLAGPGDRTWELVARLVAGIARREPQRIHASDTLRGELGFDSLMILELLVGLEAELGQAVDAAQLAEAERVQQVVLLVDAALTREHAGREFAPERTAATQDAIELPPVLREAAMHWLGQAQAGFFGRVMRTKVLGAAHVPQNDNFLVVANHASHLDMGVIKYALGPQGKDLHSLAAQDYFFEGNRWRRAYFENLTNLVPLARRGSLRHGLQQAGKLLEQGHTVLLFPEGTRSVTGQLGDFKPLAARLALEYAVDVLPIWVEGTHRALPKGAKLPATRDLQVRVGAPLKHSRYRELTGGLELSVADQTRLLTRVLQRAVFELSQGRMLDWQQMDDKELYALVSDQAAVPSMKAVFSELERRFVKGSVDAAISYYFSLGEREKWTLWVDPVSCRVAHGKAVDVADCVLKTSPDMFTKIVRDRYSPAPHEFLSGAVKSNNIPLLMTFQRAFRLSDAPRAGE